MTNRRFFLCPRFLAMLAVTLSTTNFWADQTSQALTTASDLFRKGSKALQSGEIAKAKELLTKATGALANFPEANLLLGNIAIQEKQYAEALTFYERARDGYGSLGDVLFDLRMDRFRDAQRQAREYRDELINLDNPRVKINNADARKIQIEELIRKLELIRPPSPENKGEAPGEIYFYVGNAQFYLGKVADAVGSWEQCAAKAPGFPLVHNNLAIGYLKLGRARNAAASLATAEQLGVSVHPNLKKEIEQAVAKADSAG